MSNIFEKYNCRPEDKLNNFEKYVRRQSISRFLARYELFKQIKNIKGSIIECGVHHGGGLMAWAKLSSALEPYDLTRKVVGFDTFEGFPDIGNSDIGSYQNENLTVGAFSTNYSVYDELMELIKEYDENRFLSQYNKVCLVKGDACKTIPQFISDNQHIIISLLFLDFDLYEPTITALNNFVPRMPKGAVIAFDEVNNENWPGETKAFIEYFGDINRFELKKFEFDPNISYIVL